MDIKEEDEVEEADILDKEEEIDKVEDTAKDRDKPPPEGQFFFAVSIYTNSQLQTWSFS